MASILYNGQNFGGDTCVYYSLRTSQTSFKKPEASLCFIFKDRNLERSDLAFDRANGRCLSRARTGFDCKADTAEVTSVIASSGERILLVGLNEAAELNPDTLRRAGGGAVKALHKMGIATVRLFVNAELQKRCAAPLAGRAFGEGLGLGAFSFSEFKASKPGVRELSIYSDAAEFSAGVSAGLDLAESTNFARYLAATPPNVATTTFILNQARALARRMKNLRFSAIQGAALRTKKMVGLINVGKASESPPCMIQLDYQPKGKSKGTVLLVGKTICYDTGGLSIKPREGMRGMKYDKCGGMAVLGAMRAVSLLKPKCRVIALLPTAENSISNSAYRVDDIITYPNNVSVEITNTDAEGRLVLADGLLYGCKTFKPDAVIDLATLTGGVVVALGGFCAGYWCEDEKLRERLERASIDSGERLWRLPLNDDYRDMMKAKHADLWNSAPTRDAHPIQGAAFLSYFVDAKIPWAHVDIAGAAETEKEKAPFTPGPTGFGVRLLASLLKNWE